ncbi:hypothetical protein ACWGJ9_11445 [Curtobacterium citreum]
MRDDLVALVGGIDYVMVGLDPDRVSTRVFCDASGDVAVEVLLESRVTQFDRVAVLRQDAVEVTMDPAYASAHAALASEVLTLFTDQFEVVRRDDGWALLDLVAQADVRAVLGSDDWSARSELRRAVIADGRLTRYNDVALERPAARPVVPAR